MNFNKRLGKIEQAMNLDGGPPPGWALRVAEGANVIEDMVAKVTRCEPIHLTPAEIIERAKEIFLKYGTEGAYIESISNCRLPPELEELLDSVIKGGNAHGLSQTTGQAGEFFEDYRGPHHPDPRRICRTQG